MKAVELIFKKQFIVTNGTKEIGLTYLSNTFSESDNLTFSITGGVDKDLLSIDATTGVLTFNEQAFVDTALDFDRDGIYDVQITVSGADGDTQTANLGVEVAYDSTLPQVSDLSIAQEVNESGATVLTLTGKATDDGSGMNDGSLGLYIKHALTGEMIYFTSNLSTIALDAEGNFSLSTTLDASHPDGLWYISYVSIEDKAGNRFYKEVYQSGNAEATLEVANGLYLGASDKTLPQVSDLSIAQEVNESGATVLTLTGKATDDGSGMNDGSLGLYIKHALTGEMIYFTSNLSTIALDAEGNFSLSTTLDASHPDGLWYISYVSIEDKAGNRFYKEVYQSGNAEATLEVANGLYLGASDKTLPQVSDLSIAQEVNESGATVLTLTGKATDDGSGMNDGSLGLYIKHALTGEMIYFTSNLSTIALDAEGNFSLSTTLDASDPDGLWYISYVSIEDKAGNRFYKEVYQSGNAEATLEVANGLYLGGGGGSPGTDVDNTAPEFSDMQITTYTEDGYVWIKISGTVTDDNFNYASLFLGVADNPEASELTFSIYNDQNYTGDDFAYTHNPSTGAFTTSKRLDATNISGTYYLDRYSTEDMAQNRIWEYIQSGGTDTPLLGLSINIDNPIAVIDNTAPEFSDMQITTYTEDGYVWIKISGTVTDDNFNYASLFLGVADNPEASEVTFSIYNDQNYTGDHFAYTHNPSTGAFTTSKRLDATNISGTYYLDRYTTEDMAQNRIWEYIQSGGTDTPLLGLSINIDNPIAVIDNTAPEFSDMQITTYTEDGYVWIKISGTVTDDNFNYASLFLGVADNPEASEVTFSIYNDQNYTGDHFAYTHNPSTGAFTTSKRLDATNISGTYYLDRYSTEDMAQNRIWEYIQSGGTDTPLLGLSIDIAKDAPISIAITASNLDEGQFGSSLGKIQVNGSDDYGLFNIEISGADADLLEISSLGYLRLKSDVYLDYEAQQSISFDLTVKNTLNDSLTAPFEITVNNINEQPSKINLSRTSIDEGINGASVGILTTADEDTNDTFTYTLSGVDASLFEVVDDLLKLKADVAIDLNTLNSYSVTITSTDSGGLSVSQDFTLTVNDINQPVTSITLGTSNYVTVAEGLEGGEAIGDFIIDDPDLNEVRTYLLTGRDAKYFEVVDGSLKIKSGITLDFEALTFEAIDADGNILKVLNATVTVIDSEGYTAKNDFTVYVSDVNDAPNDIILEGSGINNGQGVVGKITVNDGDDKIFTYSIDNNDFEIEDGFLKVKDGVTIAADLWETLTISISATDSANNVITQTFNLTHISVHLDSNSFKENDENPIVAHINQTVPNPDYLDGWTISLNGSDARLFKVNSENDIEFIGSADFETRASYNLLIVFTHSSGFSYESMQTINVLDQNDSPDLWYSHANNLAFLDEDVEAGSVYSFGITEEIVNPYIMTLEYGDQDFNDSYSIQITYRPYSGYYQNGKPVYDGDPVDITDLFIFDQSTGALFFNGTTDFESISGNYSGLTGNEETSHLWHEPVTITITDSSGASSEMTVLMNVWDNADDGQFNLWHDQAYSNFNSAASYGGWIGGLGDSDTDLWPSFDTLVQGDLNGDNVPDLVAWMTNQDYGFDMFGNEGALPENYSYMRISLGGEYSFPYYDGTGRMGYHDVFGEGQGSVYVILPTPFTNPYGHAPWNDIRYYQFEGMDIGDFNGDGKDDVIFQIWSPFTDKDYLVIGYGQDFDPSSFNTMDLSNVFTDETYGRVIDLTEYSDDYLYIKDTGDLNGDGKDDIVLIDSGDTVVVIQGAANAVRPSSLSLSLGLNEQDQYMGDDLGITIGDFNGDGRDDLAISSDMYDKTSDDIDDGGIFIYLNGFNGSTTPNIAIVGNVSAQLGYGGLVNLGDMNGDGYDDLGFADTSGTQWIYWGNPSTNENIDLSDFPGSINNISAFENNLIDFDNVTAIGDINGDGFDDLAFNTSNLTTVLYGMSNWQSAYLSNDGLNLLEITNSYADDLFAIGDWDQDGKDEFVFAKDADSLGFGSSNYLKIWQGEDAEINTNGFSRSLETSSFQVNENSPGAIVGSVIVENDTTPSQYEFFIQRVYADGSHSDGGVIVDNLWFDISSNGEISLKPGVSLDAEEYSTFTLRVYVVDNSKDQISQHYLNVSVNNINEAPTFSLSNRIVDETATAGTLIGALASTDADGDEVEFSLSGQDADMFVIDSETNEIKFAESVNVDIDSQVSFNITITAQDNFGLESVQNISIEVNVAPTDLTLDTNIVQESVRGAAIGQLNVTDRNVSDEFTYSISGEDAWMFNVTSEGVLELADEIYIDYETKSTLDITITATDISGQSISKDFSINSLDINYSTPQAVDVVTPNWVVPKSGNEFIDGLIFGFTLDPDFDFNTPLTITFSFIDTGSVFYGGPPNEIIDSTELFESAVSEMFAEIGALLGINFVLIEETDSVVGDIRCGLYNEDDGALGYCEVSGIVDGNIGIYTSDTGSSASNIWFNTAYFDPNNFNTGEDIYATIVHEIGHAIGLAHPQTDVDYPYIAVDLNYYTAQSTFDYWDVDQRFIDQYIGVGDTANRLINVLDWQAYSIMSYDNYPNQDWSDSESSYRHSDSCVCAVCNGETELATVIATGEELAPAAFMALDIWALMYIYNYDAETDTWNIPPVNNEDTTYVINGPVFETIHDTGGVDTIDLTAFDFDIQFNLSFFGFSYDQDSNQYIYTIKHNEIGTNLLTYGGGEYTSGYILNLSPFSIIENLFLGSGNDRVSLFDPRSEVQNLVLTGGGNDEVSGVSRYDNIYTQSGDDSIYALGMNFSVINGGSGYDSLSILQNSLDNGLYSIDLRAIPNGKIVDIEEFDYSEGLVGGKGQILVSMETFKSLGKSALTINATWGSGYQQAVGLEGDFKFIGSTDAYDIYSLSDADQTYYLKVWKDHYVFRIEDTALEINLSNTAVAEETWFVGDISISGESWINPVNNLYIQADVRTTIYSLSGDDAEMFQLIGNKLYFTSQPDYESKSSYSVTITGLSLSGKTVSQTFTIEIKDVDELSFTSGDDEITGTDSADYLNGAIGNDSISGGDENDYLNGGEGNDILHGDAGNDSLFGWSGEDEVFGGSGNDLIYGHEDPDQLFGNEGEDVIYGGDGDDQIEGGSSDDEIYGEWGNDLIYGDSKTGELDSDGNDSIDAGSGDDQVWGRGGDDTIYGGSGDDVLRGGSGNDVIRGGYDNDYIVGQSGNDILSGDSGDDIIYGDRETGDNSDDGNDILWGGLGNDELYGRGGDDYLIGQSGSDILWGGEGADVFVLAEYNNEGSKDIIKDYVDGTDKIGLISIDFDSLTISQDANTVDTNIADADGNIIAVLEGVMATDIDEGDFVSLNYDLSEILEVTPSMANLDLISLGVDDGISENISNEATDSEMGSSDNSTIDVPSSPSSNNSFNSNALISGDLINSLIDHTEDLSIGFNDFI
jgi:Ca2+-binding RTX toxin-like protein/DUF971 family protein/acetolactate synthase small subunit